MKITILFFTLLILLALEAEGQRRRKSSKPKVPAGQGIGPCGNPRTPYGYFKLIEAGIYDSEGKALKNTTLRGIEGKGLGLIKSKKYKIRVTFQTKKSSPFRSLPKYMAAYVGESFQEATNEAKRAYKTTYREDMLTASERCSAGLVPKEANTCNKITTNSETQDCPLQEGKKYEVELEFQVPAYGLGALTTNQFRVFGLEEELPSKKGCNDILAIGGGVKVTEYDDMICFKFDAIYKK